MVEEVLKAMGMESKQAVVVRSRQKTSGEEAVVSQLPQAKAEESRC